MGRQSRATQGKSRYTTAQGNAIRDRVAQRGTAPSTAQHGQQHDGRAGDGTKHRAMQHNAIWDWEKQCSTSQLQISSAMQHALCNTVQCNSRSGSAAQYRTWQHSELHTNQRNATRGLTEQIQLSRVRHEST